MTLRMKINQQLILEGGDNILVRVVADKKPHCKTTTATGLPSAHNAAVQVLVNLLLCESLVNAKEAK